MKELREEIYKKQFFEYEYDNGCEKANEVLKSIENIDKNPLLLNYVFKSLEKAGFPQPTLHYIVVHQKYRTQVFDHIINKVFNSFEEAENYTRNSENFESEFWFEPYSIKFINSKNEKLN